MQAQKITMIQVTLDETETQIMAQIMQMAADSDHTSGAYSAVEQSVAKNWLAATEIVFDSPKGYRP